MVDHLERDDVGDRSILAPLQLTQPWDASLVRIAGLYPSTLGEMHRWFSSVPLGFHVSPPAGSPHSHVMALSPLITNRRGDRSSVLAFAFLPTLSWWTTPSYDRRMQPSPLPSCEKASGRIHALPIVPTSVQLMAEHRVTPSR